MNPEQQARVITQMIELREAARIEYVRYLRQYQALDLAIKCNLPTFERKGCDKVQGYSPSIIIFDEIRPLTNKKRTGKLNR